MQPGDFTLHRGTYLHTTGTLQHCNINNNDTIHVIPRIHGGGDDTDNDDDNDSLAGSYQQSVHDINNNDNDHDDTSTEATDDDERTMQISIENNNPNLDSDELITNMAMDIFTFHINDINDHTTIHTHVWVLQSSGEINSYFHDPNNDTNDDDDDVLVNKHCLRININNLNSPLQIAIVFPHPESVDNDYNPFDDNDGDNNNDNDNNNIST